MGRGGRTLTTTASIPFVSIRYEAIESQIKVAGIFSKTSSKAVKRHPCTPERVGDCAYQTVDFVTVRVKQGRKPLKDDLEVSHAAWMHV